MKPRERTRRLWSESCMRKAIFSVCELGDSVNNTSKRYGIPEPTLRRYVHNSLKVTCIYLSEADS